MFNRLQGIARPRNLPFRSKMILSFFIVIGLTALIMGYSYDRIMSRELQASTLDALEKMTKQTADTLNLHFKTIGNIGFSYFSDPSVQKFLDGALPAFDSQQYYRNKLEAQKMQNPLIAFIKIASLRGDQYSSYYYYNSGMRETIDNDQESLFDQARRLDGYPLWTVSLTKINTSREPVHTISYVQELKRITSNSQTPIGFIKIDMDPSVIEKTFLGLRSDDGGTYYIADREGRVVFADDREQINASIADSPLFAGFKRHPVSNRYVDYRFDSGGQSYIGFYQTLGYGDWLIIGSAPLDRMLEKIDAFRKLMIYIALASFLAAMLLGSVIAASVTRPLKELNRRMKQVEMGDLQAFIRVKGNDELATIQHSFNNMTFEIRSLIHKVYETGLLKKEAEIQALQSQINPHFLFNTLSTIDSISTIDGDERISYICLALGSMLRYNLNGGGLATVEEEVLHLNQYLSIYEIRFAGQFAYEIDVEPGTEELLLPKFLIQPLVENALIHGLEQKLGRKSVRTAIASQDANTLRIEVSDNGIGMDADLIDLLRRKLSDPSFLARRQSSERTKIGLANVFRRIEMYFEADPQVAIDSNPGTGTRISFLLPKRTSGGNLHENHDR